MVSEQRQKIPPRRDPLRRAERRRSVWRFIFGLIAALVLITGSIRYGILAYPPPWKAVSPASARFDIGNFRFPDYRSSAALTQAMNGMFPRGTPKAAVDRVLAGIGGASMKLFSASESAQHFAYRFHEERGFLADMIAWMVSTQDRAANWYVLVQFDRANKVVDISATVDTSNNIGRSQYTNITPVYRPPVQ
jgi:hypothetical protein